MPESLQATYAEECPLPLWKFEHCSAGAFSHKFPACVNSLDVHRHPVSIGTVGFGYSKCNLRVWQPMVLGKGLQNRWHPCLVRCVDTWTGNS
jgi:hypothetical protein